MVVRSFEFIQADNWLNLTSLTELFLDQFKKYWSYYLDNKFLIFKDNPEIIACVYQDVWGNNITSWIPVTKELINAVLL